jgi:(2S)-methylsuccinyl-CoA dehydrogenase
VSLEQAKQAVETIESLVSQMADGLADRVEEDGRLSRSKLDEIQPEAFNFARSLAELEAAQAAVRYAEDLGQDYESSLAAVYVARIVRTVLDRAQAQLADYGLDESDLEGLRGQLSFVGDTLGTSNLDKLAGELLERGTEWSGAYGLSDDHDEVRKLFGRVSDEQVAPIAEHIHREDDIIPEDLLSAYAELGVFGISIPTEYGGSYVDNLTMCLATEELSRGSVGAGGSVITRPEICAKAVLKGGTEEQKEKWLPPIAQGEKFVSVAVTEPNAGSDVADLRVSAKKVDGGYVINGEKTWCTFAGRADVFILLARTGEVEDGWRGLTMFLVEKEPKISEDDHHKFEYEQEDGGRVSGTAIPTLGYRGMHSFSVSFENYFVPDENRIGEEGNGFKLQMAGFAGGRIQTAARAVGLMEAALRSAKEYTEERQVFGKALSQFAMTRAKLVEMAATIMASRQLTYQVCGLLDEGEGQMEASLVKLMSCRDAEWISREALQLHGGMGYSLEYDVSRYFVDARVLSIFEGAEEVLALSVVARTYLRNLIKERQ